MTDRIAKETFTIMLTYEMTVNPDTGEVLETRLVDRSINKSAIKPLRTFSKKEIIEDDEPKLFLESNKFRLNQSALKLMGISAESESKLDIKYEDNKGVPNPILGTDEAFGTKGGNKLTKAGTVAFRGSKNEELSKYGETFTLVAHQTKPGLFILSSEKQIQVEQKDTDIRIDEEDTDLPFDLDLTTITEDKDAAITEIDNNFFNLNL